MVWQDIDPVGFMHRFADRIYHVDCFRMLNTIGYDGPISVEWKDAGMDRLHGAAEAVGFVRSQMFPPASSSFDAAFAADS